MSQPQDDARAVRRVIAQFSSGIANLDPAAMYAVWDRDYEGGVYQPEELVEPLFTAEEVRDYLDKFPSILEEASDIRSLDFRVDVLGDVAHAYSRSSARLTFHKLPEPVEGEVRQTFVLRKRDGQWRFIHYHESRVTPGFEEALH